MARITCNFISYTLKRTVDITAIIPSLTMAESFATMFDPSATPPKHQSDNKYPVLYLLHGYGNNHAAWSGYARAELFAEERNIAVIMVSAENKFYLNNNDDHFYDFINEELPDFIKHMFPVSDKVEDTYIAGLSMGGFGALYHGLKNPQKYGAIGSFSGAVSLGGNPLTASLPEMPEPIDCAKENKEKGLDFPKIYISCGDQDFLHSVNLAFKDDLAKLGIDVKWTSGEGFNHEWRFWDQELEAFLEWLPRTDYYKDTKRST